MTNADHVKAFRLFELSRAESEGKDFHLEVWEQGHLQECAECRSVVEVFARQFKGRPLQLPDRNSLPAATFKAGDQIQIISPGDHHSQSGTVTEVIEPKAGDFVYRYRVGLPGGASATFFGFELELTA